MTNVFYANGFNAEPMTRDELIEARKKDIWNATNAYLNVTYENTDALEMVSETFVDRYARDSVDAKMELRNIFRKSPAWNEQLDALVINGNRTHEPDYNKVGNLAYGILKPAYMNTPWGTQKKRDIDNIIQYFGTNPNDMSEAYKELCIESMERVAPKAYVEGKKPSRIFKAISVALGVADETAGSEFQRKFAELADELSSKTIDFKLYVSINPAHFFTMSNPHGDRRGETLISCHSLNSDYEWKNGCVGYGRDKTSIIAFTVADYTNPNDFYNRKTSRQIYAYEVGNGVLLQSRMYNTSGGTSGVQSETAVYRDLIEREISFCEDAANLWKLYPATGDRCDMIHTGRGFGGYKDWTYSDFKANICIREDKAETCHPITVGTYGLCVCCGDECSEEILCCDCREEGVCCNDCGEWHNEEEMHWVYDEYGNEVQVCDDCFENYMYCEECGEYHPYEQMTEVYEDYWVCNDCLENYYEQCSDCGDWHRRDEMYLITNPHGEDYYVCEDCYMYGDYESCPECGEDYATEDLVPVYDADGDTVHMCPDCADCYDECPECGAHYTELDEDGCCPACGCIIEERDEDEDEEREVAYA